MRRLIAYLTLCLSILLMVGVSFSPVLSMLNSDMNYSNGYEVVYQLTDWENSATDLETDESAAQNVANEMATRLNNYDVDSYEIEVEGNDIVRVTFATIPNATVRANIEQYLAFSGGDFSLATENEETRLTQDQIFEGSVAYIEYNGVVPYVIIPVSNSTLINTMLETFNTSTDDTSDDSSEEEATADIFLWANWVEGDDYEKAQNDEYTNAKIIASFNHENLWYPDSDEAETEIQYLCGYADSEGNYDVSRIEEANNLAVRVCNFFNASKYEYEITLLYDTTVPAQVETLVNYGAERTLAMSLTLIATIVAMCVVSLILILFYRLNALAIISNTAGTTFLTMVLFVYLGSTFNAAALVAILTLGIASIATNIIYCNAYKEEIYKGRASKKAYQEAMKKITMPTIDLAVIFAFAGLMCYFAGGNILMGAGVIFFFGALFLLAMNLLVFRLMMYFVSNANNLQNKYKVFAIEEKMVPDLSKEEKPTYEAPYEKRDFTKHKKPIGIVAGVLFLASIIGIAVFGSLNGGLIYNSSAYTAYNTQVYVVLTSDVLPTPTITDAEYFEQNVLPRIYVNDEVLTYSDVEHGERSVDDYDLEITIDYDYYVTSIDGTFDANTKYSYLDENDQQVEVTTLAEAFDGAVMAIEGVSDEFATERIGRLTDLTPNNGWIALATSMLALGATIYFCFRYGISRALSSLFVTVGATTITVGFFVLTRIETLPIIGVAMVAVALYSLIINTIILHKEKELCNERHGEKLTNEEKQSIFVKAIALAAGPSLIVTILAAYLAINYFGIGPIQFALIFAAILLGVVLATIFAFVLLSPIVNLFERLFSKITLHAPKRKKVKKVRPKSTSSEPEETIFIGIND